METTYDTLVIGSGQAGLSAAYHLAKKGVPFLVLDANDRIGGSWLHRWDSLTLFTPSIRDSLPGMEFGNRYEFPTTGDLIDYMERYVQHFRLPVRLGTPVDGLFREGDGFRVTSGADSFLVSNVVLATGAHRAPRVPALASELGPEIRQMHSSEYRNPAQLRPGPVLIVGAGNSGAEIAIDVSGNRDVLLAGRDVGCIPIDIRTWQGRVAFPVLWWVWENILTERTKVGRKAKAEALLGHGEALIRQKEKDLRAAGVERRPRITGIADGLPVTEDGERLEVANVIWCTGYRPGYDWLDLPGLDASGRLECDRGAVTGQPGLFVLGQEFQYMFNSHTVGGVGKDAAHVVEQIVQRSAERAVAPA